MYCPACGKAVSTSDAFCAACGQSLKANLSPSRQTAATHQPKTPGWVGRNFGMRCPHCSSRGYMKVTGTSVVTREPGYQTVKRQRRIKDRYGNTTRTEEYQEQIHVVKTTIRTDYRCANCGAESHSTKSSVGEGTLESRRKEEVTRETLVVQKEVVKVPCRYCGSLNEIATTRVCGSCGAAIK